MGVSMMVDEKVKNKLILARRAIDTGDYSSAKTAYQYVLRKEPDNVEAMFYVPYSSLMAKKRIDYKKECDVFTKNFRVVMDTLKSSNLGQEEKAGLCNEFLKCIKKLCNFLFDKIYDWESSSSEEDAYLDAMDYNNSVDAMMASACVYTVNGGGIDLYPSRFILLEMIDESLKKYGWVGNNTISNTLRLIRNSLIDKMREMGDDLSNEDRLEKDYAEKEHNKLVEGKVIVKIREIMDEMK